MVGEYWIDENSCLKAGSLSTSTDLYPLTMLDHAPRNRPDDWRTCRSKIRHSWLLPFIAVDWCFEWMAFALSHWSFLEVLEYLGSFSVLVAVIFYFSESGDRLKQKHYQAWQVINTAQGKGGSGGRIEALQELDQDGVPLVGVDVSGAFLRGIRLPRAALVRSNFNAVDARNSDFHGADFTESNLQWGNFRESNLGGANFRDADLSNADLCAADLSGADLDGTKLDAADLSNANLSNIKWQKLKSLTGASLWKVRNPPPGFLEWAAQHGSDTTTEHSSCQ